MGSDSLKRSSQIAILNANYIAKRLEHHFEVMYSNKHGLVAHELIINCKPFKKDANVTVEDIAKRLMDYGFHAPTMSWPVSDTLMIEPTESEGMDELNRYCDALISIKIEIDDICNKKIKVEDSPLKNAPHTMSDISESWKFQYSTNTAFFPGRWQTTDSKFWPSINQVDNAYGDRNLICTCTSITSIVEEKESIKNELTSKR